MTKVEPVPKTESKPTEPVQPVEKVEAPQKEEQHKAEPVSTPVVAE